MTEEAYSNMPPLATKPAAPAQSDLSALRDLALSLKEAGQVEQALLLLKQLAISHPGDAETLRQSARLLNEQGRILECLHTLLSLKTLEYRSQWINDSLRARAPSVISDGGERYNRLREKAVQMMNKAMPALIAEMEKAA